MLLLHGVKAPIEAKLKQSSEAVTSQYLESMLISADATPTFQRSQFSDESLREKLSTPQTAALPKQTIACSKNFFSAVKAVNSIDRTVATPFLACQKLPRSKHFQQKVAPLLLGVAAMGCCPEHSAP